jgi:hypothetical protein
MPVVRFGGEGKQGGELGVNGGQNAVLFLREEGSSGRRQRVREVAAAAPGRASGGRRRSGRLTGWARLSVRRRWWGRLGQKGGREMGHG